MSSWSVQGLQKVVAVEWVSLDATEVPTGIDVPAKQRACRASENGFTFGSRDCALRKVIVDTGLDPSNNTHHGYSCGEWEMRRVGRSL
jgi:hypothetical protein